MKKIILFAIAAMLIACSFGCNKNNNATPTAKVAGVPNNSVATVDGLNITNKEYQTYLHNNFGSEALKQLIEAKIMEAWAKDEGVSPTKEQIEKEIQKLKDDGQYEDALEQLGESGINDLIMEQVLRTNISKKLLPPTDEDIKQGYENFKSEYVHGERKQCFITIGQDKAALEEIYKELENITDIPSFEKKVKELSKKYEDDKTPRTGTLWISDERNGAPEDIIKAVKNLKVGDKTKVAEIKDNGPAIYYFLIVKKVEEKCDKKLEEVKDDVTEKVALMNSMTKPEFRDALQARKEKAEINIKIEKYQDIAKMITAPAAPMMAPAPAPAPAPKKK
ncbi:MAG: peptidyl-prolyl cis-trans isomerase [Armatimonadetes bacterium]|nr:peptidyl-prolyl cis-trans isomerase [Candidatus Hippobium faecium]